DESLCVSKIFICHYQSLRPNCVDLTPPVDNIACPQCPKKFIWRRGGTEESEEPKYLIFNHRRIIQDERYYVVMADLNEFKMDLKIESVKQEDEGKYICMYRRDKEKTIHERHIYLKMLVPSFINPNGSSNTKVVVREGLTQKLTCNATGVPAPGIDWYMSTPDGERKLISAVDQPIRPAVKMGAQILHRRPYQTTVLFATIIGNPIQTLYWEFDHKPIISVNGDCRSGDKYCVISDREISNPMTLRTKLTIYNLTLEDYGTYSCVVHSPFGAERGSTELVRQRFPTLILGKEWYHRASLTRDSNSALTHLPVSHHQKGWLFRSMDVRRLESNP
ncbi:hypothetical protein ACTXT7_013842, partial [Hymenolepis weldensis]